MAISLPSSSNAISSKCLQERLYVNKYIYVFICCVHGVNTSTMSGAIQLCQNYRIWSKTFTPTTQWQLNSYYLAINSPDLANFLTMCLTSSIWSVLFFLMRPERCLKLRMFFISFLWSWNNTRNMWDLAQYCSQAIYQSTNYLRLLKYSTWNLKAGNIWPRTHTATTD